MSHQQRIYPSHRVYVVLALICLIGLAVCPSGFTGRTLVRVSTDKVGQFSEASDTEKVAATSNSPKRNRPTKPSRTASPGDLPSGAKTELTQGAGSLGSRESTPDAVAPNIALLQGNTTGESEHTDPLSLAIGAIPAENFALPATPYAAAFAVYEGYLDSAACDKVYGWAWDKNLPNSPINVDIFDGGSFLQTVSANEYRVDLPGNKYHGFSYFPSASLKDGRTHNIYARFSGTSTYLTNSPKSLTCAPPAPTISGYSWNTTPTANQPFGGTITGMNFISGIRVFFCVSGTGTCYEHPSAGISLNSSTRLSVSSVNLGSGSYQVYVQTTGGQSARSSSFTVQSAPSPPTISGYSWGTTPMANQPFSGTITGTNFISGIRVFFCVNGTSTCYEHPSAGISVNSSTSLSVSNVNLGSGSYQIYVQTSAGQSARSTAFTVQAAVPTITGYSWNTTPTANQPFNGTITGTGFVSGIRVFFCVSGTSTCYEHPSAGITVNSSTSLGVTSVNLGSGSYQVYVQTSAGQSARSTAFNVQGAPPTITGYSWSTTPVANQAFSGTITGTGFIAGLRVFFCVSGTSTCYEHPSAGITLNSSTSLTISNVNLGSGSYQIYVQTSAGQSARSTTFTVQSGPTPPTITGYSWSTTPTANQPFGGTITGTNFISGIRVFFCVNGTSTCYEHPSAGITVNSSTSLSVSSVNLGGGSYQIYVQTSAGQSARSAAFSVQTVVPTITGYSWTTTPTANQPFGGTITGTGFVSGIRLFFCIDGTSTCYEHPSAGITVNGSTSLSVSNVNLGGGSYQFYVQTTAGQSSRSAAFSVQQVGPTITGYSWSMTPTAFQLFGGTITGTEFVSGTRVFFCVSGTSTCYEHPSAGVSVNSPSSLSVSNVSLGGGSYQIYVQTAAGQSAKSTAFTVQTVTTTTPTVTSINPAVPVSSSADQDVTVLGSNFQPNLMVTVTFPSGGTSTLSGTQIRSLTPSSFVMRATLNGGGTWSIQVTNPDGGISRTYSFTVVSTGSAPEIKAINPASPIAGAADQKITVTGINFQPGLKVGVVFPNGAGTTLQGSGQIQDVSLTSFTMVITLNGEGNWGIRVLNLDGSQSGIFPFTVGATQQPTTGLPTAVQSPVIGKVRVTQSNEGCVQANLGKWEFDQHRTDLHRAGGGISGSNDKFAWDANLYTATSNCNDDVGEPVYATAEGDVVSYAGKAPGAAAGGVLIAHPNKDRPVWWSGYLHMQKIRVSAGQHVTTSTVLGEVGRAGTSNDHLHFVVYRGENRSGGLISFDAAITERGASVGGPTPSVGTTNPTTPTMAGRDQDITVVGNNFQQNLNVSVGFPGGGGTTLSGEQVLNVTPTSFVLRISLNAAGNWTLRVNNPDGGQSSPHAFQVQPPQVAAVRPVIFIPGITGSVLEDRDGVQLWPPQLGWNLETVSLPKLSLELYPQAQITPKDVVRGYDILGKRTEVYSTLISMLTDPSRGGLREYQKSGSPTLFLYPYDWRKNTFEAAQGLKNLVGTIQQIYPGSKVTIIAHSMGGLVARRYIIDNPSTNNVEKVITIGSPWLGAPKAVRVLQTGQFMDESLFPGLDDVVRASLKRLSIDFQGVHELLPSSAYFDLGGRPFAEDGWDINGDGQTHGLYTYPQLVDLLNRQHPRTTPGTTGLNFHGRTGQDNWSDASKAFNTQIQYYHFYGVRAQQDTVGKVIAEKTTTCGLLFCKTEDTIQVRMAPGDGTVPTISAARNGVLNAPGAALRQFQLPIDMVGHQQLVDNRGIHQAILCAYRTATPAEAVACMNGIAASAPVDFSADAAAELPLQPVYSLRVTGAPSVLITDDFGNTIAPMTDTPYDELPGVIAHVAGSKSLVVTMPTDRTHTVTIKTDSDPIAIELTKGTDVATQAVRYRDLSLPPFVTAVLKLTPQGAEGLKYDTDGDGVFETPVAPTASAAGTAAQDTDAPTVSVTEQLQPGGTRVSIAAADAGSGVKAVYYSLDSVKFNPYTSPFDVLPSQTPVVYAYADDTLANRSGLVEYRLSTALTVQFDSSNYGVNEGAEKATMTVTRFGDTSSAATVNYATSDGTASEKSDYTASLGSVSFEPGQASKSFDVLITDDAFVEAGETVNIRLSGPAGASLGTASAVTLTITDNDVSLSPENPVEDAQFYVRQHYHDFLNREPDATGLQFWTDNITSCGSDAQCREVKRINVSAAFFLSIEFQNTGYLIYRMYKTAYGDATSPNVPGTVPVVRLQDFLSDSQRIGQGVVVGQGTWEQQLETNKAAFALEFVQRQRFLTAYPLTMTPAQFIDRLNQNAGGVLTQQERDQLVAELSAAADVRAGRASVLRKITENQSLQRNEFNRAFVLMQYYGYLRRNPDDPQDTDFRGWRFWLDKLNQFNGNFVQAEMVKAFLGSTEYRRRFGQ
jgi:pimeloyl-ACP methyl ester carboxylesterase